MPEGRCPDAREESQKSSFIPSTAFAESSVAVALQYRTGTILVIGANEGKIGTDPSFKLLASRSAAHMHKMFIEPVPFLYHKLRQNIRTMPRAQAHQVAVANYSGTMEMYCFATDPETGPPSTWPKELLSQARFASAKKEGRDWWSQVCSLDRDRLFHKGDMGKDFTNAHEMLDRWITSTSVRVVTIDELLRLAPANAPIRHVQIDVEGFDDIVLALLPLGQTRVGGTFRPATIVFEASVLEPARVARACAWLRSKGYSTCREGQNVVAFALPP